MPIYKDGQPYVPVLKVTSADGLQRVNYELETESKDVIEAINEVNAKAKTNETNVESNQQAIETLREQKASKTAVEDVASNLALETETRKTADTNLTNSINNLDENKQDNKPDGVNLLIENNKITKTYVPDFLLGQLVYGGNFNATSKIATLSTNAKTKLGLTVDSLGLTNDNVANTGYGSHNGIYYLVSEKGEFAGLDLNVGDWLISKGDAWTKIDNTDAVTGVKGNAETNYRMGNVNITKENIGLGNVDNTSDLDKPISTATQEALNEKQPNLTFNKGVKVTNNIVSVDEDYIHPVGYILEVAGNTDLTTAEKVMEKYGNTWEVFGSGQFLLGVNGNHPITGVGSTGGEETHTLTIEEMPSHQHSYFAFSWESGQGGDEVEPLPAGNYKENAYNTANQGGNQPHNNMPPYKTIYRYIRTA